MKNWGVIPPPREGVYRCGVASGFWELVLLLAALSLAQRQDSV